MRILKRLSSLFLVLTLFLTGCENFSLPTNANTAFRNFTLSLFKQEVSANTVNLHYSLQNPDAYGIHNIPITLGSFDYNETTTLASIENLETSLHKFSYDTLSKENQITYDILSYYFETAKESISYYLYDEPLSPVTGIHAQLPVLLAEYQFYTKEDVNTYLALLETVPDYFSSLIRFETQKSDAGVFMCDANANEVINQCDAFIAMGEDNYLLSTFSERVASLNDLSSKERSDFIAQNEHLLNNSIIPAYQNLAFGLSALKETGGTSFDNTDYYTHLVATSTGSGRSISELKALIQSQIASDLADSRRVLSDNPSITETTSTRNDSPNAILSTLENKITNAFPAPASVSVEVKYVPSALEPYLSPAFYLIPAIDNYKENTIYINQAYSMDNVHLFTTLAHEGYPGHLYQTTYYASTNPDPIRTLLNFPGYVEGWATYAEMCSYYISSLEKPYATLLQKNNSLILGLYATADIGIHYDKWTLEDTTRFFSTYGIDDVSTVEEIYNYILGDPANYLTYYIGYLEILELKQEMITETGDKFSQKDFHQKILEIGPAPFEIVRKYMFE